MCQGALGLSTGLFYAPQSFSTTEEVIALAREAGRLGGVYDSHIRDESSYTVGLLAAIDEEPRTKCTVRIPIRLGSVPAGTTSYLDTGLTSGVTYRYVVRAVVGGRNTRTTPGAALRSGRAREMPQRRDLPPRLPRRRDRRGRTSPVHGLSDVGQGDARQAGGPGQ